MSAENVISAAIAEAREAGVVDAGETDTVSPEVENDEGETAETDESTEGDEQDGDKDDDEANEEAEDDGESADDDESDDEGEESDEGGKKKVKTDDDDDAKLDQQLDALKKRNKGNPIPHPVVQGIVKRAESRLVNSLTKILGLNTGQVDLDRFDETLATAVADIPVIRERVAAMDTLEPIMLHEPDNFIRILAATHGGEYQKFVDFLDGKVEATAEGKKTTADEEMPGPDAEFDLGEGKKGKSWSVEGVRKLLAWHESKLTTQFQKTLDTRFKPLDEAQRQSRVRQQTQAQITQDLNELLSEAYAEWDGFKEAEAEIRTYMREKIPTTVSMGRALRKAYQEVVVKRLKTTKQKVRKQVLEEGKRAARATSASGGSEKRKSDVVRDEEGNEVGGTRAVIHRELAKAKARGLR